MRQIRLGFSVADQSLRHSKSIGILNVSQGLLPCLAARPEFSELVVFSNSSLRLPPGLTVKNHDAVAQGRAARLWWDQFGAARAARRAGCDWLFLPKGFSSFLSRPPLKIAAYVHDAMHDFYRTRYPGGFASFEKWYFACAFRATLQHANIIFTNSEFTAREVARMAQKLALPAPRAIVAGIGFTPSAVTAAKENQIAVPVSKWPHKLTARALDWLARWQTRSAFAGSILLVGDLPAGVAAPAFPNWKYLSRLAAPDFDLMLARCRALVYFSEYEGFGMPPIEAILHGAAPVYSRIPAMMETAAGSGFPFDNDSYDTFAAALDQALACPTDAITAWSRALALRHSWLVVAERIGRALTSSSPGADAAC